MHVLMITCTSQLSPTLNNPSLTPHPPHLTQWHSVQFKLIVTCMSSTEDHGRNQRKDTLDPIPTSLSGIGNVNVNNVPWTHSPLSDTQHSTSAAAEWSTHVQSTYYVQIAHLYVATCTRTAQVLLCACMGGLRHKAAFSNSHHLALWWLCPDLFPWTTQLLCCML